jgi:hypothetical protein
VSSSRQIHNERTARGARAPRTRALVVRRHHILVRISHWRIIPLLLGLILSGISIYWVSPIYRHNPDPQSGTFDYLADAGIWICAHIPWLHHYADSADWVYNHISLGPFMLAFALRFHWLCAFSTILRVLPHNDSLSVPGKRHTFDLPSLFPVSGHDLTCLRLALAWALLAARRTFEVRNRLDPI